VLEEVVINALRNLKLATFEEIRRYLREVRKEEFLDIELRKALTRLVREGKVEKIPDPKRSKFLFRLSPSTLEDAGS
jgi:glucose-6-phosphate-specific signal transduction histidine kinase